MLFQLHQVVWSLWKGLLEESLKQGELTRVDSGGLMQQGKHSLGHLFMEWHIVRPKTMLILLLCHLQVRPLCSNTPPSLAALLDEPFPRTPEDMVQLEQHLLTAAAQTADQMLLVQLTRAHEDEAFVRQAIA